MKIDPSWTCIYPINTYTDPCTQQSIHLVCAWKIERTPICSTACRQKTIFYLHRWAIFLMTAFGFGTLFAQGISFILHLVYLRWDEMWFDSNYIDITTYHNARACPLLLISLLLITFIITIVVAVVKCVCSNRFFPVYAADSQFCYDFPYHFLHHKIAVFVTCVW